MADDRSRNESMPVPAFSRAGDQMAWMILVLLAVGAGLYWLTVAGPTPNALLIDAFRANPYLNGLILAVFVVGVIVNVRAARMVTPAARWVRAYAGAASVRGIGLNEPALIKSAIAILAKRGGNQLSPSAARAILDSVGVRIDEGRELRRYVGGLLVFLGLLGTFWGLLQTIDAIAGVIANLSSSAGSGQDAVGELIANLNQPLSGMATAFSSSLFGLGGSLVVGLMDIQAAKGQNRFYAELEDWLANVTDAGRGGSSYGASYDPGALGRLESAIAALAASQDRGSAGVRQEIRDLGRTLLEGSPPERR